MKHRISLACTLMHQPELLFLDETSVSVDPELRISFWDYFNNLKIHGSTLLITPITWMKLEDAIGSVLSTVENSLQEVLLKRY